MEEQLTILKEDARLAEELAKKNRSQRVVLRSEIGRIRRERSQGWEKECKEIEVKIKELHDLEEFYTKEATEFWDLIKEIRDKARREEEGKRKIFGTETEGLGYNSPIKYTFGHGGYEEHDTVVEDRRVYAVPNNVPQYGSDGETDPRNFVEKYEATMIASRFPIDRWSEVFPSRMQSVALLTKFKQVATYPWEEVKEMFLESQLSSLVTRSREREFARISKKKNETVRQYTERFEDLAALVGCEDSSYLVFRYVDGLRLDEGFHRMLRAAMHGAEMSGTEFDLIAITRLALNIAAEEEFKEVERTTGKVIVCYYCKRTGHKELNCEVKRKQKLDEEVEDKREYLKPEVRKIVRCYLCNEMGHVKNNCPRRVDGKLKDSGQDKVKVRRVKELDNPICGEDSDMKEAWKWMDETYGKGGDENEIVRVFGECSEE